MIARLRDLWGYRRVGPVLVWLIGSAEAYPVEFGFRVSFGTWRPLVEVYLGIVSVVIEVKQGDNR